MSAYCFSLFSLSLSLSSLPLSALETSRHSRSLTSHTNTHTHTHTFIHSFMHSLTHSQAPKSPPLLFLVQRLCLSLPRKAKCSLCAVWLSLHMHWTIPFSRKVRRARAYVCLPCFPCSSSSLSFSLALCVRLRLLRGIHGISCLYDSCM